MVRDNTTATTDECYSMKPELLTNASVVDDAIKFTTQYQQQQHQTDEGYIGNNHIRSNQVF